MSEKNNQLQDIFIELYDAKKHRTRNFSCGNRAIDNYLQRTAKKHTKNNIGKIWVATDDDNNVIGYYGVAADAVDLDDMPEGDINYQKIVGRDEKFPAVFISMFGVDKNWQGKQLGRKLIREALEVARETAEKIAVFCVVLNVGTSETSIAEKNMLQQFYAKLGFEIFPQVDARPLSMFITIKKIYDGRS